MVRYAAASLATNPEKIAAALTGLKLTKAYTYLSDVSDHKQIIPFRRFSGGVGRASQAKQFKATQGRWPEKSVKFILRLLKNAESNADAKNLELEDLFIKNIVVQQAPKTRRRTYRAHGRINPYQGSAQADRGCPDCVSRLSSGGFELCDMIAGGSYILLVALDMHYRRLHVYAYAVSPKRQTSARYRIR
ncbi:60S ribosomal protein L17 [Grifola frondosa]|uniref:60S ribosomal protein L17 n=1 Tax=Grifola frondosa TaxID=5627 RepID=A0A1C7M317_GRIFR|nr:60S ribosomal protein L17 [Grifola frondosa]